MAVVDDLAPSRLQEAASMAEELREIELLTRELLEVLEPFWFECRLSALKKGSYLAVNHPADPSRG